MTVKSLMPYRKERALEDVAFGQGLSPVRLFTVLLPVWRVEVKATTVEGKPYELIDRYLERGIAEGGLHTAGELSRFLGLDDVLVDRALRFLHRIGHLTGPPEGTFALTDLGRESHRDQVRYVKTRENRLMLYFDVLESRPFTRRYYKSEAVTFLSPAEVKARATGDDKDFKMLTVATSFRHERLAELSRWPDRDRYNLPHRLENPESLGADTVFLPVYVVRAMHRDGKTRLLAYGQAAETADPELGALCEKTPEITATLANEETDEQEQKDRIVAWLTRKELPGHKPVRFPHGGWRVVLPASAFAPDGPMPLGTLGSFTSLKTAVVHVWCEDRKVREQALLKRAGDYFEARKLQATEAGEFVARAGAQLGFEAMDLPTLRSLAEVARRTTLVSRIDRLKDS